jgi:hypothetical protein
MINEYEFFHGAAILGLIGSSREPIQVLSVLGFENSAYSLNGRAGIYIKYSKKRLSPWTFTFTPKHQSTILKLYESYGEVFIFLVCNDDGVVGFNFADLRNILDDQFLAVEWIRVSRTKRKMYQVSGSDGKLSFRVGGDDYISKVFSTLNIEPLIPSDNQRKLQPSAEADESSLTEL